jgi:hypothetical protein
LPAIRFGTKIFSLFNSPYAVFARVPKIPSERTVDEDAGFIFSGSLGTDAANVSGVTDTNIGTSNCIC